MIAFDTNVLLRLYVNDDNVQHAAVKKLVARLEREGEAIYLSTPVLCELVWALKTHYEVERAGCLAVLDSVLSSDLFTFEHVTALRRAAEAYRKGKGDFADYVIQQMAATQRVATVYTYDKALLKEPGFTKP